MSKDQKNNTLKYNIQYIKLSSIILYVDLVNSNVIYLIFLSRVYYGAKNKICIRIHLFINYFGSFINLVKNNKIN